MQINWSSEEDSRSIQGCSVRTVDSEINNDINMEKLAKSLNFLVQIL